MNFVQPDKCPKCGSRMAPNVFGEPRPFYTCGTVIHPCTDGVHVEEGVVCLKYQLNTIKAAQERERAAATLKTATDVVRMVYRAWLDDTEKDTDDAIHVALVWAEEHDAAVNAQAVRLYNAGYHAGHEATVEGCYIDILPCDMGIYHADVVAEIIGGV